MEASGQLQTPDALLSGKEPTVPMAQEAGWGPKPVWTYHVSQANSGTFFIKSHDKNTWVCDLCDL
jgi:hypothetical protein